MADIVSEVVDTVTGGLKSAYEYATNTIETGFSGDPSHHRGIDPALSSPYGSQQPGYIGPEESIVLPDSKYSYEDFSYPIDILSPQYGGNYVIFYVNVLEDSRIATANPELVLSDNVEGRMRGAISGQNISRTGVVAGNAGYQVLDTIASGKITGAAGLFGAVTDAATDLAVTTVQTGLAAAIAPEHGRSTRRLKNTVVMHVPNQLNVRYQTSWSEANTVGLSAAVGIGTDIMNAIDRGNLSAANIGSTMQSGVEAAANLALQKVPNAGAVQAALGVAPNPKKEQTFQGVDFRKFTFDYQFYPRSPAEAANVLRIVQLFKYHMHPEYKSVKNFVWLYPSEFDIEYYSSGRLNTAVHQHTSCILEGMSVNYTPNGQFNTFPDGTPTQINMTLEFKELMLATKETIGVTPGGL